MAEDKFDAKIAGNIKILVEAALGNYVVSGEKKVFTQAPTVEVFKTTPDEVRLAIPESERDLMGDFPYTRAKLTDKPIFDTETINSVYECRYSVKPKNQAELLSAEAIIHNLPPGLNAMYLFDNLTGHIRLFFHGNRIDMANTFNTCPQNMLPVQHFTQDEITIAMRSDIQKAHELKAKTSEAH